MAAPIYGSKEYIKHFYTTDTVEARPVSWLVALHTGNPGTGDASEVSGGTYARQSVAFTASEKTGYWEAENVADVAFPAAGVGQNYTVTHYTIRDGGTGQALSVGVLPVPIPIVENSVISFPASYIKVRGV